MKGRERAGIGKSVILFEIGQFHWEGDGFPAMALVVVLDDHLNTRHVFLENRLEHAEPKRLEPDVRVIEILNGRLNQ